MIIQRIAHIILTGLSLLLASCNAWLDVTPENAIADKDLFATGFGYRNALNGIYDNLASDALYGRELTWGFVSALSQQYNQQDGTDSPLYADAASLLYQSPETEPVVTAIWERGYKVIANLNQLLAHLRTADAGIFEYGTEEKSLIHAEALALRAMMHFDLLRLFAPAPATHPTGTYLPYREHYQATVGEKLTVEDFIEKVLKDLSEAEPTLHDFDTSLHPQAMYASRVDQPTPHWNARYRFNSDSFIDDRGSFFWYRGLRMNYLALLAFKARVCLYAGTAYYKNAETAAKELYNVFYKQKQWIGFTPANYLTAPIESRFVKVADDVLMGVYRKQLAADYEAAVWRSSSASSTTRLPLANVQPLFASDHTGVYTDYRFDYLIGTTNETHSKYYTLKYNASNEPVVQAMENPLVPLIRFSEICHILAEICSYYGKTDEGIAYLETVRKARGAERTLSLTVKTPEQLNEEIRLDRRKETLAEGETFYMYKRLNSDNIPNSNGQGTISMAGAYVLPIPISETTY